MRTIVVDDEPWMLKRFAIECEGIPDVQVLGSFRSPVQALAFAKEHPVELAFLDMEMPEMNGLQLAAKLRELYPELIVIFISAYESYMAEAFKSKSADYYIMKPYNTGDVEAAIDRAPLTVRADFVKRWRRAPLAPSNFLWRTCLFRSRMPIPRRCWHC